MTPRALRPLVTAAALVLLLANTSKAAVYEVPTDEALVLAADSIVYGRVVFMQPLITQDGSIVTDTTIEPIRVLKGASADRIVARDPGGVVGSLAMGVSGWSGYQLGSRVLVFLQRDGNGLRTWGLALGKFIQARDEAGVETFHRGGDEIFGWDSSGARHVERPRRASDFLLFIQTVLRQSRPAAERFPPR